MIWHQTLKIVFPKKTLLVIYNSLLCKVCILLRPNNFCKKFHDNLFLQEPLRLTMLTVTFRPKSAGSKQVY